MINFSGKTMVKCENKEKKLRNFFKYMQPNYISILQKSGGTIVKISRFFVSGIIKFPYTKMLGRKRKKNN